MAPLQKKMYVCISQLFSIKIHFNKRSPEDTGINRLILQKLLYFLMETYNIDLESVTENYPSSEQHLQLFSGPDE